MDGSGQTESNAGLATTTNSQEHLEVPRILQILSPICQTLLSHCTTTV
jgi:hypothetical protein